MSNAEDARRRAQYAKDLKTSCEVYPGWASKKIIELEGDPGERENDPLVAKLRAALGAAVTDAGQAIDEGNYREATAAATLVIEHLANAIRALEGR